MKQTKKVLVANRGEIAIRVMRTCKELGIKTVAVYSEADRGANHVIFADEAVLLGPAPSSESYLVIPKVIQAAVDTGADAIHPGYGFLSENAEFAREAKKAGIIFIGPSPEAISLMGSKLAAKEAVSKYQIPMVPGTPGAIEDPEEAKKIAKEIGFPILIKASAGGGGKGMRLVENEEELESQMERAVSEATSAFGDGSVFIEKFVTKPRHIEFQILGDSHGNFIHLFERECSIQRRHQKVVEEAPSSVLTPELREKMGEAAVNVARACDYEGAGTVEFMLDADHNFYFLEMNTRLQVEHPVTELITGIDLVEEQISIAEGNPISFKQEDLKIQGHAIELRVYAEDPKNNFLPDTGTLEKYITPKGNGVRLDDGFSQGQAIPIFYDPMISKLSTYGRDRKEAIAKMIRAIEEYSIVGVQTTLPFGTYVMKHEAFISGHFDTNFVGKYYLPDLESKDKMQDEDEEAAAILAAWLHKNTDPKRKTSKPSKDKASSAWKLRGRN